MTKPVNSKMRQNSEIQIVTTNSNSKKKGQHLIRDLTPKLKL